MEKAKTLLRYSSDLKKDLEKLAQIDDRSLNNYIVKVLDEHVKANEKYLK